MWRLPNGKTISQPKDVTIDNVSYPAQIFRRWTKEELNAHGIKPFREVSYDSNMYRSTASDEIEADGEVVKTHTLVPRYTNQELRGVIKGVIKLALRSNWKTAKEEIGYLEAFDASNPELTAWIDYLAALKQAASDIKMAYMDLASYQEGVEFLRRGYLAMLPTRPDAVNEVG